LLESSIGLDRGPYLVDVQRRDGDVRRQTATHVAGISIHVVCYVIASDLHIATVMSSSSTLEIPSTPPHSSPPLPGHHDWLKDDTSNQLEA